MLAPIIDNLADSVAVIGNRTGSRIAPLDFAKVVAASINAGRSLGVARWDHILGRTSYSLAVGQMKLLEGLKGGVATIALKDDAEFRIEVECDKEELATTVKQALGWLVDYVAQERSPQAKVWNAARIAVTQDGTTVTATGRIPGKLLAEEYAKRK